MTAYLSVYFYLMNEGKSDVPEKNGLSMGTLSEKDWYEE